MENITENITEPVVRDMMEAWDRYWELFIDGAASENAVENARAIYLNARRAYEEWAQEKE